MQQTQMTNSCRPRPPPRSWATSSSRWRRQLTRRRRSSTPSSAVRALFPLEQLLHTPFSRPQPHAHATHSPKTHTRQTHTPNARPRAGRGRRHRAHQDRRQAQGGELRHRLPAHLPGAARRMRPTVLAPLTSHCLSPPDLQQPPAADSHALAHSHALTPNPRSPVRWPLRPQAQRQQRRRQPGAGGRHHRRDGDALRQLLRQRGEVG
jgi:hypothetical protein